MPALLSDLPCGAQATVVALRNAGGGVDDAAVRRLMELGFLPGEPVRLLRRGPGGREPLAVQVGENVVCAAPGGSPLH